MSHIEADGVMGRKRKAWKRTFDTIEILRKWEAKHDATHFRLREVTEEEWRASRRRAA